MHMSLRAVLFTSATVGWVFATLGVLYHDVTARDVGLLVTVAALGLAVLASDATAGIELPRRRRERRARRTADAPERAPEPQPKPAAAPGSRPVAAPAGTRAAWSAPTATWDADADGAMASPVAMQEPVTVAAVPNGNGHAFATAPPQPEAQGPTHTRGLCGKCRTPITVSMRRPLRVTCPVCGHSKVLA